MECQTIEIGQAKVRCRFGAPGDVISVKNNPH